ncbi:MAG: hypothetical protein J3R72DRAFT_488490 [Linnemannia gamsii]|nr:MAG: hypothetical protein J3R72DRAFT_488490 [Linnemannia gamsii]
MPADPANTTVDTGATSSTLPSPASSTSDPAVPDTECDPDVSANHEQPPPITPQLLEHSVELAHAEEATPLPVSPLEKENNMEEMVIWEDDPENNPEEAHMTTNSEDKLARIEAR